MNKFFDNSGLEVNPRSKLVKANLDGQLGNSLLLNEKTLEKAVSEMDLLSYDEEYIDRLRSDLVKGFNIDKTISEENFEKAKKDLGKLIKTTVLDKNGVRRIVYLARKEYKSHTKGNKSEIEATIARQKALLANPKSPASARKRAEEILKVEGEKLTKEESPEKTKPQITYKRVSTNEPNVSDRTVSHEVYVDGKFRGRHAEVDTAKELIDQLVEEGGEFNPNKTADASVRENATQRTPADSKESDKFSLPWKEKNGYFRVTNDGDDFSFDSKTGVLSMDGGSGVFNYQKKLKNIEEADDAIGKLIDGGDEDGEWELEDKLKTEAWSNPNKRGLEIQYGKNIVSIDGYTNGQGPDHIGMMTELKKDESFVFSNDHGKYKITSLNGKDKYNIQELSLSGGVKDDGLSGNFDYKEPKVSDKKVDKAIDKLKGGNIKASKDFVDKIVEGLGKLVEKHGIKILENKPWSLFFAVSESLTPGQEHNKKIDIRDNVGFAKERRLLDDSHIETAIKRALKIYKEENKLQKGDTIISFDLSDDLEKAHKDLSKLIKTTVMDKNGHRRTVYISRKEYESHTKSNKDEILATIKRQESLLDNPKSPESAKKRAREILKVERAKLGSIDPLKKVNKEPLSQDSRFIDKNKTSDKLKGDLSKLKLSEMSGAGQYGDSHIPGTHEINNLSKEQANKLKKILKLKGDIDDVAQIGSDDDEADDYIYIQSEGYISRPSRKSNGNDYFLVVAPKMINKVKKALHPEKMDKGSRKTEAAKKDAPHDDWNGSEVQEKFLDKDLSKKGESQKKDVQGSENYFAEKPIKTNKVDKNKLASQTMIEAAKLHKRGHAILSDIWSGRNQSVINDVAGNHIDAPTVMKIIDLAEKLDKKFPEGEKIGTSLQSLKSEVQEIVDLSKKKEDTKVDASLDKLAKPEKKVTKDYGNPKSLSQGEYESIVYAITTSENHIRKPEPSDLNTAKIVKLDADERFLLGKLPAKEFKNNEEFINYRTIDTEKERFYLAKIGNKTFAVDNGGYDYPRYIARIK